MNAALLQTKLFLPIPRPDRVPRPRLTGALDGALQPGGKVILVCAPAGSGKSTLVANWLQELADPAEAPASFSIYEPCWLSLDEGDNDLARFLVYLVAALERVAPGLGEGALTLLRGPQPPPVESFMTALINELTALTQEETDPKHAGPDRLSLDRLLILVLDDYHLIQAQPVHDALTFLMDHLPGQMRLALISRTEPPLPLARLRGRGHLLTLDGNDLRFTDEEARLFLNRIMGLDLSQAEVSALADRTEGWIAGLQMAALALSAQGPGGHDGPGRPGKLATDQLAGARYIMDYLLQEVLQSQPAELQAFLLQTAILDRLSSPLCDALTGQAGSQTILAELERRNLFLFPLDQAGRWYRYHHLFAELLRQRLEQTQPETVAGLHRRACAWYQANGFMAEAIHHALAAGDDEQAALLVEKAADPALMRGQFQTILNWLRLLPEDAVRVRPRLGVYQAFLMLLDSQPLTDIEVILRAAEEKAAGPASDQVAPAAGETMLIRAVLALLLGDLQTGAELSQQAMALLPEDTPFLRSLALRNLASIYSMTGEVVAAGNALTTAVAMAESMGDKTSLVLSLYSLARVRTQQGRLRAAHDYLLRALSVGRDRRGRPLPIVARVLTSLADIKREWNELNEAARLVQDGIALTRQALAFWGIGGYVILSQIRQSEGAMVAAQAAMDVALELAIRFDATDLDDRTVELYQARLQLALGDLAAVDRWATRLLDDDTNSTPRVAKRPGQMAGWYVIHEMEQIHLARLRLAQERPEEARRLLEKLRPAAENKQRGYNVIAIDLLLALAWVASGDKARALDTLERTLALAEPEGYTRVFLDEGPAMAALLQEISPASPVAGYARDLSAAFAPGASLPGERISVTAAGQPLSDPLSKRELDVLRLLPSHLTSTEIAAELSISANTARFHIKNIYSKLNAHTRTEAVAQAQQLGLI